MKQLYKQIKEERLIKGLTQQELADKSGISLRSIQRIENGEVYPRSFTLKTLCENLSLDFDTLNTQKNLPPKEEKVMLGNKAQKIITSCVVAIVFFLLACAFIFQSPTFPETAFEMILLLAFVIGAYGVVLFKLWR